MKNETEPNNDTSKTNNAPRHVETVTVETDKVATTTDETTITAAPINNEMPGGVVILPLPTRPITPVNIHPKDKIVETTDTPNPREIETPNEKNMQNKLFAQTVSHPKEKPSLKRCSVLLNKLSATDLKRLCKQKIPCTDSGNPDPHTPVETCYQTRSSVKLKQERHGTLPRSVSANVSYEIKSASSEEDKSPAAKKRNKL